MTSANRVRMGEGYIEITGDDSKMQAYVKGLGNTFHKIGMMARKTGAAMMRMGAVVVAAFIPLIKAASRMQEVMGKFDVVFAGNSEAVKKWSDNLAAELGRSKRQVADFMSSAQDLFVPLGFDATSAIEMSKQATQLAVDLASFNNMADPDVMRDLQAALTGSGEVMKKYGVIVSEAAVKQELMNMNLDPKIASNAMKVQARLNIIMAGTTAAQGDALRTGDSFANLWKRIKAELEDTSVEIGKALLPMLSDLLKWLSPIVKDIAKFASENRNLIKTFAMLSASSLVGGAAVNFLGRGFTTLASIVKSLTLKTGLLHKAFTFLIAHPLVAVLVLIGVAVGVLIKGIMSLKSESELLREEYGKLEKRLDAIIAKERKRADDAQRKADEVLARLANTEKKFRDLQKTMAEEAMSTKAKEIAQIKEETEKRRQLIKTVLAERAEKLQTDLTTSRVKGRAKFVEQIARLQKAIALAAVQAKEGKGGIIDVDAMKRDLKQARFALLKFDAETKKPLLASSVRSDADRVMTAEVNRFNKKKAAIEKKYRDIAEKKAAAIADKKRLGDNERQRLDSLRSHKEFRKASETRAERDDISIEEAMLRERFIRAKARNESGLWGMDYEMFRSKKYAGEGQAKIKKVIAATHTAISGGFLASRLKQVGSSMEKRNTEANELSEKHLKKIATRKGGVPVV